MRVLSNKKDKDSRQEVHILDPNQLKVVYPSNERFYGNVDLIQNKKTS